MMTMITTVMYTRCEDTWPYVCEIVEMIPEQIDVEATSVASINRQFPHSPTRKLYYTIVSVVLFFLPVTVMSLAYAVIICRLWLHRTPGESAATRRSGSVHRSASNAADEMAQVNVKVSVTLK